MPCNDGGWGMPSGEELLQRDLEQLNAALSLQKNRLDNATRAACTMGHMLNGNWQKVSKEDEQQAINWFVDHCMEDAKRGA